MFNMCKLRNNQIKALTLYYRGDSAFQIHEKTGMPISTVYEAIKRGKANVDKALETIEIAVAVGILSADQKQRLNNIMRKL